MADGVCGIVFTDTLWPDFNEKSLNEAIASFQNGERRFGRTPNSRRLSSNGVENYVETTDFDGAVAFAADAGYAVYAPMWLWAAFCGPIAMLTLWEYARMSGLDKLKINHYLASTLVFGVIAYAGGWRRLIGLVCRIGVLADCRSLRLKAKWKLNGGWQAYRLVVGDAVLVSHWLTCAPA